MFNLFSSNKNFNLNENSVNLVTSNTNEVMVYGFDHCKYKDVIENLKKDFNFKKVDKWDDFEKTLEGRKVNNIELKSDITNLFQSVFNNGINNGSRAWFATRCKETLLNLFAENYQRDKESKQIIPLIYCVDINNNPYPFEAANIASQNPDLDKLITHKELRLCYKVVNEIQDIKFKKIASETLKFVKLNLDTNNEYSLEPIAPFWESTGWEQAWEQRQLNKKNQLPSSKWRDELAKHIQKIDSTVI